MRSINPGKSLRRSCFLLAVLLGALPETCLAAEGAVTGAALLSSEYPAGSIRTDAAADDALLRAGTAREEAESKFADEERVCYSRFFVNACISDAKEERHLALSQIKRVEIEANVFKRAAKVKEHDRMAAEKASEERSLQVSSEPKAADERVAEHEEKLKEIEEKELAEAPQRAHNVEVYEEKVKEAEERKRKAADQKAK